jgi:hypothetical protein
VDFLEIAGRDGRPKSGGPSRHHYSVGTWSGHSCQVYSACTAYYSCLRTRTRSKRSIQTGINQCCNYWATVTFADGTCLVSKFVFSCACAISPPVGAFGVLGRSCLLPFANARATTRGLFLHCLSREKTSSFPIKASTTVLMAAGCMSRAATAFLTGNLL